MSDIKVEVVDVGLRDGLQNDPAMMSTEGKLEFINRLLDAGIKRMEVASFVNPKRVPQMADSTELMGLVPRDKGVKYIGLALNDRGLERAIEAKCEEVNFVVVASMSVSSRWIGLSTSMRPSFGIVRCCAKETGPRIFPIPTIF